MLLPEELCCGCWRKTTAACVWMFAVSCCSRRRSLTPPSPLPVESWFKSVPGTCTHTDSSPAWLDWQRVMRNQPGWLTKPKMGNMHEVCGSCPQQAVVWLAEQVNSYRAHC